MISLYTKSEGRKIRELETEGRRETYKTVMLCVTQTLITTASFPPYRKSGERIMIRLRSVARGWYSVSESGESGTSECVGRLLKKAVTNRQMCM